MNTGIVRIVNDEEDLESYMQRAEDDLIPLADIGFSTGAGAQPLEPVKRSGNTRLLRDPTDASKWRYSFHPEQEYGEDWINQHELAYAAFVRNAVVDFARSVAGELNRSLNDVLETGFGDIEDIMRDAMQRQSRYFKASDAEALSAEPQPIGDVAPETLKELQNLSRLVRNGELVSRDLELLLHNSRQREMSSEYARVRFLTLPYNLRRFYFKPSLKAAVEKSLQDIREIANIDEQVPTSQLFSDLVSSESHNLFVQLVAKHLEIIFYRASPYGRTNVMAKRLENELEEILARNFLRYSPEALPTEFERVGPMTRAMVLQQPV